MSTKIHNVYGIFSLPNRKNYDINTDLFILDTTYQNWDDALKKAYCMTKTNKGRQIYTAQFGNWTLLPFSESYIKFTKKDGKISYEILENENNIKVIRL